MRYWEIDDAARQTKLLEERKKRQLPNQLPGVSAAEIDLAAQTLEGEHSKPSDRNLDA